MRTLLFCIIIIMNKGSYYSCYILLGYYKNSPNISCHTNLSSSENSIQEWWTLAECTDPIHSKVTGPPILLIYSRRITSQVFNIIAGFG